MAWGMRDEDFKVQLFRFVDVLPTLKTDEQFTRLLAEYFGGTPILPKPLKWSLQKLPSSWIGSHVGALVLRRQFTRMAHTFMAGDSMTNAMPVLGKLWLSGRCASVDLLGEATVSEAEADAYRDHCLDALRVYHENSQRWPSQPLLEHDHHGVLPRANLSIKISALYSQLNSADPDGSFEGVTSRLRPILDLASQLPASITFDMEQYELKDLTYEIFMRIFSEPAYRTYACAGIALQTYLRDADMTLDRMVDWVQQRGTPITIRLVKGAYWDAENIQNEQRGWPTLCCGKKQKPMQTLNTSAANCLPTPPYSVPRLARIIYEAWPMPRLLPKPITSLRTIMSTNLCMAWPMHYNMPW